MVFEFSTDAMKCMWMVDVLLHDVHLELEDDDHDVIHAVYDHDVHLELEDDDHDVIHAVSSPLSFKVVMKKLKPQRLLMYLRSTMVRMMSLQKEVCSM